MSSDRFLTDQCLSIEYDGTYMTGQLFGTDGIRGAAGVYPLDDAGAQQIGKAIGAYFAKPGERILVGQDPRQSSPQLVASVVAGLRAMGSHVDLLGVLPTPGLAYLTKREDAAAGVMITASHNPYTDNGIKVFSADGRKLTDDTQAKLNKVIGDTLAGRPGGQTADRSDLIAGYVDFLVSTAQGVRFDGLSLAVDCANGATSTIAAKVFESLGAAVTSLFDKPDGVNINAGCGATDTRVLQKTVADQRLMAGAAFDGDGDRLMMADANGRQLNGDHIMYILAVAGGLGGVTATIMSNMGLDAALKSHGITLKRTAVGDRYVLEGLEETGYALGGEQGGHVILPAYALSGDGLLAAVQVLKCVKTTGKSLAQWFDELKLLPQELINIPLADKTLLEKPAVRDYIAAQTAELGTSGRLNVRPSGTEPKARVMVESSDAAARARTIADQLTKLFEAKE